MTEYMKVEIGRIDEPFKVMCFQNEETIQDILAKADIKLSLKEDVYDTNGNIINLKEPVKQNRYFIQINTNQNIWTTIKKIAKLFLITKIPFRFYKE